MHKSPAPGANQSPNFRATALAAARARSVTRVITSARRGEVRAMPASASSRPHRLNRALASGLARLIVVPLRTASST